MRRHKIEILAMTKSTNDNGFPVEVWTPISVEPLWADIKDQGSKEYYGSNAENRRHIIRCNISYTDKVSDGMRIRWDGKDYEITRMYNGDYRQGGIDLDGTLIEGSVD